MLFGVVYTFRNATEEREKRGLQLFTNWTPPQGFEFKAHYALADGSGGIAIVEASSSEVMYEANAPFTGFIDFKISPVVDMSAAVPILQKTNAWRDSVC